MRKSGSWLALVAGVLLGLCLAVAPSYAARNASGTYSLPAGHPFVTGTAISSTVMNNTMNDLKTEMTDSLSRSGKGPMLAPLELADGTVALPALSFDNDTDVGLYRIGANNPGFSVNGVLTQSWTTTGSTFPLGVTVTQSTANGNGVTSTGNGSGYGVRGTGGTASGNGLEGIGGAGAGAGVVGSATAAGAIGVDGLGGTAGPGVRGIGGLNGGQFSNSTNATGGTRTTALNVTNGDIAMGAPEPDSTTSISDAITPVSFVKVWGYITGGATPVVSGGLNIASVSCGTNEITVTIAADFANATYGISALTNAAGTIPHVANQAAGSFRIGARLHDGTTVDLCSGSPVLYVMAIGAQ